MRPVDSTDNPAEFLLDEFCPRKVYDGNEFRTLSESSDCYWCEISIGQPKYCRSIKKRKVNGVFNSCRYDIYKQGDAWWSKQTVTSNGQFDLRFSDDESVAAKLLYVRYNMDRVAIPNKTLRAYTFEEIENIKPCTNLQLYGTNNNYSLSTDINQKFKIVKLKK